MQIKFSKYSHTLTIPIMKTITGSYLKSLNKILMNSWKIMILTIPEVINLNKVKKAWS